ncbi:DUF2971 domain-containing protein [Pectobacterium aquaticum]|uniref:DUF2971 domain-containing protein n=1 Tax=Pectobacterium aquaticum TaxID=2204145 RepID=UPI00142E7B3F|nr:DUF2971 domain-containing protein [Pectobacterium aquaticum]UEM40623.1 DUF2971 domain-containing protein [Pectobacterium aquaticum]
MSLSEVEETCLFRYRHFNKNTAKEILNKEIWHSDVKNLNDPFEFPIILDWSEIDKKDKVLLTKYAMHFDFLPIEEIAYYCFHDKLDLLHSIIDNNLRSASLAMKEYYESLYVCCFSKSLRDPLMWSHYSDGMKGLCIAYDKNILKKTSEYKNLKPVVYNKKPIEFLFKDFRADKVSDEFKYYDEVHKENRIAEPRLIRLNTFEHLYQKHERWAYEGEVRNIVDLDIPRSKRKDGALIKYPSDAIKAILVGCKMKRVHLKMVGKYCILNRLPLYKVSPNKIDYSILIEPLFQP